MCTATSKIMIRLYIFSLNICKGIIRTLFETFRTRIVAVILFPGTSPPVNSIYYGTITFSHPRRKKNEASTPVSDSDWTSVSVPQLNVSVYAD